MHRMKPRYHTSPPDCPVSAMTDRPNALSRNEARHHHIHIGLRFLWQGQWEPLQALGWSDVGFNFFHTSEITNPALELRRQMLPFEGRLVWSAVNTSDEAVKAVLLNALIYRQAQKQADATLRQRLLRLIRVQDLLPQKQAVLASLGQTISEASMAAMIARRRETRPMYHYGVQVDSDVWRATVQKALSLSSAVESLEKWAQAFSSA
jgi:hypothetical protein